MAIVYITEDPNFTLAAVGEMLTPTAYSTYAEIS